MPYSETELTSANKRQTVSESDTFTLDRYSQFSRHLPLECLRILDVGCNTGRGGEFLKSQKQDLEIWGLDCVPERVEALDANTYSRGICSFTQNIAMDFDSVDAVVAGEFIEHVPAEQVYPTLCEFFRILKLKGRLLMTTPNPYSIWKWKRKSSVLLDPSHLTQHYPRSLRHKLHSIGFSRVRVYGSGKASRKLGEHFPLFLYGSYLITADKW